MRSVWMLVSSVEEENVKRSTITIFRQIYWIVVGELWAFVLMATSRRIDIHFKIVANGYGFQLDPQVGNNHCDLFFFLEGKFNQITLNDDELDMMLGFGIITIFV